MPFCKLNSCKKQSHVGCVKKILKIENEMKLKRCTFVRVVQHIL